MIIDISGFNTSGSGAYHDLLREYDNVIFPYKGDWEFELLWMVDGIFDLENKICKKNVLGFDADIAVQRFEHLVSSLNKHPILGYGLVYNDAFFIEESAKYIKKIVELEYYTRDFSDLVYQSKIDKIREKYNFGVRRVFNKLGLSHLLGNKFVYMLQSDWRHYAKIAKNPADFMDITQEYIGNLINYCRKRTNKIVIMDHMFPAGEPEPYYKYIKEDFKSIIVRRDPRDMYLIAKVRYGGIDVPIPIDTVENFIWYYKKFIEDTKLPDSSKRISINFEDIIYHYEETKKKIEELGNLGNHIYQKKFFNPNVSINNTQLFKLYTSYSEDIKK